VSARLLPPPGPFRPEGPPAAAAAAASTIASTFANSHGRPVTGFLKCRGCWGVAGVRRPGLRGDGPPLATYLPGIGGTSCVESPSPPGANVSLCLGAPLTSADYGLLLLNDLLNMAEQRFSRPRAARPPKSSRADKCAHLPLADTGRRYARRHYRDFDLSSLSLSLSPAPPGQPPAPIVPIGNDI
jgi:hypothetical protein